MFRYIFLVILILGTPKALYGTPEWVCQDPSGCPIVNNECPTCTLKETPKAPIYITNIRSTLKQEVTREIVREVAVPTRVIHEVAIPPSISFSNPKVLLASLSRAVTQTGNKEWRWSAKVSNFTCSGTHVSKSHSGTFRCNGENTNYTVTFF